MAVTGPTYSERRNIEKSTLEYITTQINASWTDVNVVKTFKQAFAKGIPLPVICIEQDNVNSIRREIGADTLEKRYLISIDIFSKSESMRLDLVEFLLDKLKDGWVYKTYARTSGSESASTGTAAGRLRVTDFLTDNKLDFGDNANPRERYRHLISVNVRKSD